MPKKIIAIIPARGGSKGIPNKNIKDFCGKPLLAWSIIQALNTEEVRSVYVSSDSDEILDIAEKYGAKKIKRPDDLATDTATTEIAIEHVLKVIETKPDLVVLLQVTSPLRLITDISGAVQKCLKENLDSCFSGAELEDFLIWRENSQGVLESLNYDYKTRGRRQDRKSEFVENGSIYVFKPWLLMEKGNRLGGGIGIYPMNFWQSFEMDSPEDWDLLEIFFNKYLMESYNNF